MHWQVRPDISAIVVFKNTIICGRHSSVEQTNFLYYFIDIVSIQTNPYMTLANSESSSADFQLDLDWHLLKTIYGKNGQLDIILESGLR